MSDAAAALALDAAWRSDTGRVRANNEDLPIVDPARGVYGVVDGVGGSAAGEVAAAVAREVILHRLSRPLGTPAERVREAIALANNEIYRRAERSADLRGMTCVVTLAIVGSEGLTVGHVGDSRLYAIGPGGLRKLTHDHSPVGEREDANELSELDAMRHPRRNELYRDVGGALHDKDEAGFVEVVEVPWSPNLALLACTDGLTDMVPSAVIERIVHQHAGRPQRVAAALVEAANAAGGSDNVTVVYAEGGDFAAWARSSGGSTDVDTADLPGASAAGRARRVAGIARRAWLALRTVLAWVFGSRTTWFALGALVGVLSTLTLVVRAGDPEPVGPRTLVVGGTAPGAYPDISTALRAARPGDVVSLEPGIYAERIVVPEGVDLVARVPRTVTLRRAAGAAGPWVAVTAAGAEGGRLAGLRLESTPEAPIDVGVRVTGQGRVLEMLDIAGPVQAGLEVSASSSVVLQGSVIEAPALAVRLEEDAHATLSQNILTRTVRAAAPPVSLAGSAQLSLARNVFAGFGPTIVDGPSGSVDLGGNLVLGATAGRRGTR
jgi:serine/threonine protein phosphatase PrpC